MSRLNSKGMELPDNRSLVAVCDLTPLTIGERVRRYVRVPQLRDDLIYSDENYDPDDFFDDEDRPMSPHEERAAEFLARKKARKAEKDAEAAEAARKKLEEEQAEFARRVREVKDQVD